MRFCDTSNITTFHWIIGMISRITKAIPAVYGPADVMTCCCRFFLFAPLFPSLPTGLIMPYYALCRYLFPILRVAFVRAAAVIFFVLFCFIRATDKVYYVVLLAAFPFRSSCHHILQNTCRFFCFLSYFPLFSSFTHLFNGLACFVAFSYPVR